MHERSIRISLIQFEFGPVTDSSEKVVAERSTRRLDDLVGFMNLFSALRRAYIQPIFEFNSVSLLQKRQPGFMVNTGSDLHGSAPDKSSVALLLIDMMNDLDFPAGDELLTSAIPVAHQIALLKLQARDQNVPVIYVNDNFGRWRSDFNAQVEHCLRDGARGKPIVELLRPAPDDYFVLKPKHSGFFSTTLDTLLEYLGVRTLVLAGFAANICVLFTANDAYMRDYQLLVPSDCVASNTRKDTENALEQMHKVLKADIRPSTELSFVELKNPVAIRDLPT
jgi:nicotinamidase-related amidase